MHILETPEKYATLLGGPLLPHSSHVDETQGSWCSPSNGGRVPDAWVTLGANVGCVCQPSRDHMRCSSPSPPKHTQAHSQAHSHAHLHSCTLPCKHVQRTPASAPPGWLCLCPLATLFLSRAPAHTLLPPLGCPSSPCPLASPVPPPRQLQTQQLAHLRVLVTAFWKRGKLKHFLP